MYATQIRLRYTDCVEAFDIEYERIMEAQSNVPHAVVSAAENIPYPANVFDTILSHEVLEHVLDDHQTIQEMIRTLKVGGRIVLFCPNRWYPFETHGHYWRGQYHFGNTPLINYLPNFLRNKLAPHVRAYTKREIETLFDDERVNIIHQERIYGGYDNLIARFGNKATVIRDRLYQLEGTLFDTWGLSHFVVVEKIKA
jgi:SAM-dependent methyltransferase